MVYSFVKGGGLKYMASFVRANLLFSEMAAFTSNVELRFLASTLHKKRERLVVCLF